MDDKLLIKRYIILINKYYYFATNYYIKDMITQNKEYIHKIIYILLMDYVVRTFSKDDINRLEEIGFSCYEQTYIFAVEKWDEYSNHFNI